MVKNDDVDTRGSRRVTPVDSLTASTNEQRVGHTPGPWRAKWTADGRCDGIVPDYHNHDGDDCYEVDYECPATHEIVTTDSGYYGPKPADARLIAAAPELLAACKLAELNFRRKSAGRQFLGDDDHEAWTAIGVAIAKAEGR